MHNAWQSVIIICKTGGHKIEHHRPETEGNDWQRTSAGTVAIKTESENMANELIDIKLDKRFFSVASLSDESSDRAHWLSVNPIERIRHIEILRRINYGSRAAARLQRILEVAER